MYVSKCEVKKVCVCVCVFGVNGVHVSDLFYEYLLWGIDLGWQEGGGEVGGRKVQKSSLNFFFQK